jgi:hypothetical protein
MVVQGLECPALVESYSEQDTDGKGPRGVRLAPTDILHLSFWSLSASDEQGFPDSGQSIIPPMVLPILFAFDSKDRFTIPTEMPNKTAKTLIFFMI